jgi:hypothetical protein
LGYDFHAFVPKINQWNPYGEYGYKARNLDIARSHIVFNIVPDDYPQDYNGMRFNKCYHCNTNTHIKSGGCWTAKNAIKLGNSGEWIIIDQG